VDSALSTGQAAPLNASSSVAQQRWGVKDFLITRRLGDELGGVGRIAQLKARRLSV